MTKLLLLASLPGALLAQALEGAWQGTLTPSPNTEIRLAFKIARNGDAYGGTFYNLSANRQFNLGAVTFQGNTVKFVIPGNGMTYDGKVEADGNSITGGLTQGTNAPTPVPLKRATPETAWDLPPAVVAAPKPLPEGTKLEFEVATIKPSGVPPRGPGMAVDATTLRAQSIRLSDFIAFSYELHPKQITGLPGWAENEGYDIVARLPAGGDPNDAQLRTMMKNLVRSRFGLTFHTEKRELSAYVIAIGKDGLAGIKMVKNTSNGARINSQGLGRVSVSGMTMAGLAGQLQLRVFDRPVIDQTGLTDRYDLTLNWVPDEFQFPAVPAAQRASAVTANAAFPDILTAFQELGLKLDVARVPMDVFVVDQASRPSEN